ncbi:MAG: DUF4279 domain-containing protein [Inquilinus sp.]|uniref:DUF4279 domain-containing protein n=1 Tax=Inquilinus sp. TaxID=1932117 RepID=UPI003F32A9F8
MAPYRYAISLRISHPSIDPAQITAELGEAPSHLQKAGSPHRTPKGTVLDRISPESFWVGFESKGENRTRDLPAGLRALAARLLPHRQFLRSLRDEGGEVEIFVGWFAAEQGGDVLTHELMSQLADLKIDLLFDLYVSKDEASPE